MQRTELSQAVRLQSHSAIRVTSIVLLVVNVIALGNGSSLAAALTSGVFAALLGAYYAPQLRLGLLWLLVSMNPRGWLTTALHRARQHPQQLAVGVAVAAVALIAACTPADLTARNQGQPLYTALPALNESANVCGSHVMRPGDNLFRIALAHGTDHQTLAHYNGITDPTTIQVGAVIELPCEG